MSEVTVWYMSPEELEEYRKKYPPKPKLNKKQRKKAESRANIHNHGSNKRNLK